MQAPVKVREDNKHVEFMQSFKLLALGMKKVDQSLVLEPVASEVKQGRVEVPRFLSNNFTDLSAVAKLASNAKFEKIKEWH